MIDLPRWARWTISIGSSLVLWGLLLWRFALSGWRWDGLLIGAIAIAGALALGIVLRPFIAMFYRRSGERYRAGREWLEARYPLVVEGVDPLLGRGRYLVSFDAKGYRIWTAEPTPVCTQAIGWAWVTGVAASAMGMSGADRGLRITVRYEGGGEGTVLLALRSADHWGGGIRLPRRRVRELAERVDQLRRGIILH